MDDADLAARLARLEAREAICELKARYFRAIDTHDWELLASVFDPDATLTGGGTTARGVHEVMARIRRSVEGRRVVHHGHMPEIVFHDERTASGTWAMEDRVELSPGGQWFHGFGHYKEIYSLREGGWRITSLSLDRLFDM